MIAIKIATRTLLACTPVFGLVAAAEAGPFHHRSKSVSKVHNGPHGSVAVSKSHGVAQASTGCTGGSGCSGFVNPVQVVSAQYQSMPKCNKNDPNCQ